MSAASRRRIAEAQRKRRAEYNKRKAPKRVPVKRKLSTAAEAKLAANLAKARAAKAAKQTAQG